MPISSRAQAPLLAFVFTALALTAGCQGKEEPPQAVPLPSAAPEPVKATQDPQPSATAAPTPIESAAAPTPSAATPTPSASVAETPKPTGGGASIDGCCSALAAIQKSGLPAPVKAKAATAAATCSSISKLVKEGKTPRSSALAQIRATMGGSAPSECN